ncbi:Gfd2p [Sugiyamaella lignohabitans]|uniref:Gfd2p n=1 Tax=Sugiyamaella lignohabitans TaxID=796027 RepID=A0A167FLA5_9ASCO|nr:Gfd2p [Sugiyamaella lignohabitans]ANB15443.1 Gfd2p [Sugiyamaella lignohabitans]
MYSNDRVRSSTKAAGDISANTDTASGKRQQAGSHQNSPILAPKSTALSRSFEIKSRKSSYDSLSSRTHQSENVGPHCKTGKQNSIQRSNPGTSSKQGGAHFHYGWQERQKNKQKNQHFDGSKLVQSENMLSHKRRLSSTSANKSGRLFKVSSSDQIADLSMELSQKHIESDSEGTFSGPSKLGTNAVIPNTPSDKPSRQKTAKELSAEKKALIREEKLRARIAKSQLMLSKGMNSISAGDILISVDMECWERNNTKMTEVGVSVYDGTKASSSLVGRMRNEHYIIKEFLRMRNGRFVEDNKFNYLLGKSKIQTLPECQKSFKNLVMECEQRASQFGSRVLFVGHGVKADFTMLRRYEFYLGQDLGDKDPDYFDTYDIWQLSDHEFGALGKVLKYLKINHGALHNAGNDAYFTMLLGLCLCNNAFRETHNLNNPELRKLLEALVDRSSTVPTEELNRLLYLSKYRDLK